MKKVFDPISKCYTGVFQLSVARRKYMTCGYTFRQRAFLELILHVFRARIMYRKIP